MELPKQKNFYDVKRQFQGKDLPTDSHPEAETKEPLPRGQILFGLIFIAVIALLAIMRIRGADAELVSTAPTPVATAPAHAKK